MKRRFVIKAANEEGATSKQESIEDEIKDRSKDIDSKFDYVLDGIDQLVINGMYEQANAVLNDIEIALDDNISAVAEVFADNTTQQ